MLWESIRNKITRKIIIFYLGGWKARGIPKGGFGRVLARKAKNGEKILSAGSTGLMLMLAAYQNLFCFFLILSCVGFVPVSDVLAIFVSDW